MNKIMISMLLWIFCVALHAQNNSIELSGRLLDGKTKSALVGGTIRYISKSIGTCSDEYGNFELMINPESMQDTIVFQYLGYKPLFISVEECMKQHQFRLMPDRIALNEVVVKPDAFNVKVFMRKTIQSYHLHLHEPSIAQTYFRESAEKDGHTLMYVESLGYAVRNQLAHMAAAYTNYKQIYINTKECCNNPAWLALSKNSEIEVRNQSKPALLGAFSSLRLLRVLELNGILSKKGLRSAYLKRDSIYNYNHREVFRIQFKLPNDSGAINVFSDNLELLSISLKTNDSYLVSYLVSYLESGSNTSFAHLDFMYLNNAPFLKRVQVYSINDGVKYESYWEALAQKYLNYVVSDREFWMINNLGFNPYIVYNPVEWKPYIRFRPANYDAIAHDLAGSKQKLEAIFKENSNQWFPTDVHLSDSDKKDLLLIQSKLKEVF